MASQTTVIGPSLNTAVKSNTYHVITPYFCGASEADINKVWALIIYDWIMMLRKCNNMCELKIRTQALNIRIIVWIHLTDSNSGLSSPALFVMLFQFSRSFNFCERVSLNIVVCRGACSQCRWDAAHYNVKCVKIWLFDKGTSFSIGYLLYNLPEIWTPLKHLHSVNCPAFVRMITGP